VAIKTRPSIIGVTLLMGNVMKDFVNVFVGRCTAFSG